LRLETFHAAPVLLSSWPGRFPWRARGDGGPARRGARCRLEFLEQVDVPVMSGTAACAVGSPRCGLDLTPKVDCVTCAEMQREISNSGPVNVRGANHITHLIPKTSDSLNFFRFFFQSCHKHTPSCTMLCHTIEFPPRELGRPRLKGSCLSCARTGEWNAGGSPGSVAQSIHEAL
jgi:hypothetical protein